MTEPCRVGITRDQPPAKVSAGLGDIKLSLLGAAPSVTWVFPAEHAHELTAEQIYRNDALAVLGPHAAVPTVEGGDRLRQTPPPGMVWQQG